MEERNCQHPTDCISEVMWLQLGEGDIRDVMKIPVAVKEIRITHSMFE